jgi:hypothetical protein
VPHPGFYIVDSFTQDGAVAFSLSTNYLVTIRLSSTRQKQAQNLSAALPRF